MMHVKPARKSEQGQVLPILVLALLGLAGFAALALDGGNLYTEQRRAQSAADNAVMAAALQQMNGFSGANLQNAAFANASQNGYTAGPNTQVVFHQPPVHGAYAGNSAFMEVVITQTVPTALAHLIYRQDPIPLTVIAVAHALSGGPLMGNFAIAAMKPDCDGANTIYMQARGAGQTGGTFVTDAGAFVNANCPDALDASGNHDGIVTSGNPLPPISVVGGVKSPSITCTAEEVNDPNSKCNWYPAPTTGVAQVPQDPLAGTPAAVLPSCTDKITGNIINQGDVKDQPFDALTQTYYAQPGAYTSLNSSPKNLVLAPGIYCLTGGTLSAGNNGNLSGTGVLIYLVDAAAKIDVSGSGTVNLTAPLAGDANGCVGYSDTSKIICTYLGFLVYKTTGPNDCNANDHEIDFTGSAIMNVTGLIYAPRSLVRYGGNGGLIMTGQVMAGCVKFNGNGNITIVYNPNDTYNPPPSVRLDQ